jgi:hypothetical protein
MNEHQLLNERIIKEMHKNRYNKSLSQLINYSFIGCILSLAAIAILIYRMNAIYFGPFKKAIFILAIVMALYFFIYEVINLKLLYKINYSKSVSRNIELTRKYRIRTKKQHIIAYISVTVMILLVITAAMLSSNMELWRWITIGGAVAVGIVAAVWDYKKMYKQNINSILESLNEIRELKED